MSAKYLHEKASMALQTEMLRSTAGEPPDADTGLARLAQEHEQFATWPQAFQAGEHIRTSTKNVRDWRHWRLNVGFPAIHFELGPSPDTPPSPASLLLEHLVWSRIDISTLPSVGDPENPMHPADRQDIYTAFDGLKKELYGDAAATLNRAYFPGMTWDRIVEGLVSQEVALGLPAEPGQAPRVNPAVTFFDPEAPIGQAIQLSNPYTGTGLRMDAV